MTEAGHIHFGAEFYWNYLAKKNEKRSRSDPPVLCIYTSSVNQNRIKGTKQHTESMAPAPGQSRKRMRENYVISIRLGELGYEWSMSKGHSITETVQSSVSACFSIEILLIIIPVVTIPMIELP